MLAGILMAVATGLLWTVIGIVMSYFSRSKLQVTKYYLASNSISTVLALLLYGNFEVIAAGKVMSAEKLLFFSIGAGCINAIGLLFMQSAMKSGHNAVVWGIGQSALIIPFLSGVVLFGQGGTVVKFAGAMLIICGMILPLSAGKKNSSNGDNSISWLFLALTAFLFFGVGQTMGNVPSYWKGWTDNAQLRPFLSSLGAALAVMAAMLIRRENLFRIQRKTLLIAAGMSILKVISAKMLYFALDRLSACGVGSIGYPLIVGACISGFSLYSLLVIREKSLPINWLGLAGTVTGIVIISV